MALLIRWNVSRWSMAVALLVAPSVSFRGAAASPEVTIDTNQNDIAVTIAIWREKPAPYSPWPQGEMEVGEPAFVVAALLNTGVDTRFGISAPTLAESSLDLLVNRDLQFILEQKEKRWNKPVVEGDALPTVTLTSDERGPRSVHRVSEVLWFSDKPRKVGE